MNAQVSRFHTSVSVSYSYKSANSQRNTPELKNASLPLTVLEATDLLKLCHLHLGQLGSAIFVRGGKSFEHLKESWG